MPQTYLRQNTRNIDVFFTFGSLASYDTAHYVPAQVFFPGCQKSGILAR